MRLRYAVGIASGLLIVLLWALVTAACGDEALAPSVVARPTFATATTGPFAVTASCGSITALNDSQVRYTAPSTTSTCRLIATRTSDGVADTATYTIAALDVVAGLPVGPYRLLLNVSDPKGMTLSSEANSASSIVTRIDYARQRGVRVMLMLTGGAHTDYMSTINGVLQFDRAKWEAKLATFNTAAIKTAIAAGVSDGTIVGASVMDEPYVHGGSSGGGNTWGPIGTMTKARVDSLCTDVQTLFPTLPAGVEHQHQLFEPTKSYRVCQFIVDQYGSQYGSVTTWRDAGLAMGVRDHYTVLFSLNVLDGGTPDTDGTWDCAAQGGFKGTYSPNCQMTPAQLDAFGSALVTAGCGLFMWRYSTDFFTRSSNLPVFTKLQGMAKAAPQVPCRRTP